MHSDTSSTGDDDNDEYMDYLSHIDKPECVTMACALYNSESNTDSDPELCTELHPSSLDDDLATWATALNSLLNILGEHDLNLPKDARTLLGIVCSNRTEIENKAGGRYYYFGLLKSISGILIRTWTF